MEEHSRWRRLPSRGPLRTFALGGLVGAAGALATVRRLRRASAGAPPAGGLAAFEDAPCFLEVLADEADPAAAEPD
jgi:hypothetical protein